MKKAVTLFVTLFLLTAMLSAQTPQYYNLNTGTTNNSFPFNVTGGKAVNSLFLPGDFANPTPLPAGQQITKIYFRTGNALTTTFTNLHILMAQDVITTLTTATFYPGPYDTVFVKDTTLSSTALGWMGITLRHPFVYDPTKSLIIFVGQCGASGAGPYVTNSTISGIRRVWSAGGCPYTPYAGGDAAICNFGVDVVPAAPTFTMPDLLYYKFWNNTATATPNFAVPGVGTNPAPFSAVTLTPGGQFDTCITGAGLTSSGVTPGWNFNTGTSSWTMSMWIQIPTSTSGSAYYLFGDGGFSFRCFHNGVAGVNNIILRGTGVTDVVDSNVGPGPTVVHFVYDSAASAIKVYNNGVFIKQVTQVPFNFTAGTGFRVGGYTTSASLIGKMDEFRLYKRALSPAEITATWNQNLGYITGIIPVSSTVPTEFNLKQNYPNPFNPVTKISFDIPKTGMVTLRIYDVLGKEVKTLVNEVKNAGSYLVDFDGSSFASGTYFYRLESNGFISTKKMMLIK
jgi:hypothetical protein